MGFGRYRQDLGVQGVQAARDEAGKVSDLGTTTPLTRVERRPVRQRASFPPDRERLLHLLLEDHLPEVGGDLGTPGHGSGSPPTPPQPLPSLQPCPDLAQLLPLELPQVLHLLRQILILLLAPLGRHPPPPLRLCGEIWDSPAVPTPPWGLQGGKLLCSHLPTTAREGGQGQ